MTHFGSDYRTCNLPNESLLSVYVHHALQLIYARGAQSCISLLNLVVSMHQSE